MASFITKIGGLSFLILITHPSIKPKFLALDD